MSASHPEKARSPDPNPNPDPSPNLGGGGGGGGGGAPCVLEDTRDDLGADGLELSGAHRVAGRGTGLQAMAHRVAGRGTWGCRPGSRRP